MHKNSLNEELNTLNSYLNKIKNEPQGELENKIHSHTIIGMIMTIYNLISTGAYDTSNTNELYQLIDDARNLALHYGYFNDYQNIIPQANNIKENASSFSEDFFASSLANVSTKEDYYNKIIVSSNISLTKENDLLMITNLYTKESMYVDLSDVLTLRNKHINKNTYLIKDTTNPIFYYKETEDSITHKIDYQSLNKTSFSNILDTDNRIDISFLINNLLLPLRDDPYKNIVISYQYNNKTTKQPLHKVLKKYLENNEIDERIVLGKYFLEDFDKVKSKEISSIKSVNIDKMVDHLSLKDSFFLELFLKRYHSYSKLISNHNVNNYANQSMLLNLYEVSLSKLSEEFINSDYTKQFSSTYHEYKKVRKELAHNAITNTQEKEHLLTLMEKYTDEIYSLINQVYKTYLSRANKSPLYKLSISKSLDKKKPIIHNKGSQYYLINHQGTLKIIDDKKYLCLDKEKDLYLDLERSLLVYDYAIGTCSTCIIPFDQIKTVTIKDNIISKANVRFDENCLVKFDTQLVFLLQALDYFRQHPHYKKKDENDFLAITFIDETGKATFTEGLSNLLYRRYSLKTIPSCLLNASDLLLPKNYNEPLTILDTNKKEIAKIYLAHLTNDGKLTQIYKNSVQTEIDYGKLLAKDLKINEFTIAKKEGR